MRSLRCSPADRVVAATFVAAWTLACEAEETPMSAVPDRLVSPNAATSVLPAHELVARGFALALGDAELRLDLIEAMAASEFNEHKLVIPDFLTTNTGRKLASAAAAALGLSHGQFQRRLEELPPGGMDFYVLFRPQRRSWTGSTEYAIGSFLDFDETTATAFTADGVRITVDKESAQRFEAFLMLHPAEPKVRRVRSQRARVRGVDPIDTSSSGAIAAQSCSEINVEDCDGGDPGGGGLPTITTIQVTPYFDDGNGLAGDVELSFRKDDGTGAFTDEFFRWVVPPFETTSEVHLFWSGSQFPDHQLWEDDSTFFTGADDFMGNVNVLGTFGSVSDLGYSGAGVSCPNSPFYPLCAEVSVQHN